MDQRSNRIIIERDGQSLGPYTFEEALGYLAEHRFKHSDSAKVEGTERWLSLATILGVPAPPPPPPEPLPPPLVSATVSVSPPPTKPLVSSPRVLIAAIVVVALIVMGVTSKNPNVRALFTMWKFFPHEFAKAFFGKEPTSTPTAPNYEKQSETDAQTGPIPQQANSPAGLPSELQNAVRGAVVQHYESEPAVSLPSGIRDDQDQRIASALTKLNARRLNIKLFAYEVRNAFNRTIDSETWYFVDVAVDHEVLRRRSIELLPLALVKRGNSWYSQIAPNRQIQQLPDNSLSGDAISLLPPEQQEIVRHGSEREEPQAQENESQRNESEDRRSEPHGTERRSSLLSDNDSAQLQQPYEQIVELVNNWVKCSNGNDVEQEASLYSKPVDYLDEGMLQHQQLVQSLADDRRKFPYQRYRVTTQPQFQEMDDGSYQVTFQFDFDRLDAARKNRRTGTGTMDWTVVNDEDRGLEIKRVRTEVIVDKPRHKPSKADAPPKWLQKLFGNPPTH
jgi:hypothetical protein